ncbi:MAG TPA: vitamin B12 dependent-methionine synthase activation domain-containing protein, partial [Gammaproteobacteria bacterium]|nr:vitamin B12 dependent-methionine synthase activation domain-containing protein [Gammaproteobacteria bacterium]
LLIGGATTSRLHTAVKIEPKYEHPVVHVADASRAVGVVGKLISAANQDKYAADIREEYAKIREQRAGQRSDGKHVDLRNARANKFPTEWIQREPVKPSFFGLKVFDDYPLDEIAEFIDWTPFFSAWEMAGRYPKIFDDEIVGKEARKLFDDAQAMLKKVIDDKWLTARAVIGFFPANTVGDDDIELYADDGRSETLATLHHIRQQMQKTSGKPNFCLADYIAPKESNVKDYLGAFAVTAGHGIDEHTKRFEQDHDDYSSILLKAVADRLAEALAERMHERVRKEFWGYAREEELSNDELIKEQYQGIRPAPGYPACPEHTEKGTLWDLLKPDENIGLTLTESYAMVPTAAV